MVISTKGSKLLRDGRTHVWPAEASVPRVLARTWTSSVDIFLEAQLSTHCKGVRLHSLEPCSPEGRLHFNTVLCLLESRVL